MIFVTKGSEASGRFLLKKELFVISCVEGNERAVVGTWRSFLPI
jgi:hypothetical protein